MSMTNADRSWRILTNHWNTLKNGLFDQSTKELLGNLTSEILENRNNFEGWGLILVAYKKCIGDISQAIVMNGKPWP